MIITLIIPLLAFMVLARYRVSLVPVMVPFAGLTIVELIRGNWKRWEKPVLIAGIILLFLWANSPRNEYTVKIFRNDYGTVYTIHYADSMQEAVSRQDWNNAAGLLNQFFDRYEPAWIKDLTLPYRPKNLNEQETIAFFAWLHETRFQLLSNAGEQDEASQEETTAKKLKTAAKK
jgi:hypothetical protein